MVQDHLQALLEGAIRELRKGKTIPEHVQVAIEIERPARPEHGDFSSNVALELSRHFDLPPRELAARIAEWISPSDLIAKVEVAGPGFINFYLSHRWLYDTLVDIAKRREQYGRSDIGAGSRVQVEFVSANPTGPLHVGHGRNAAYGDALASVLETAGYSVNREYYLNDTGVQIEIFARSLDARYRQALGHVAKLPPEGYAGEYLIELGKRLAAEHGTGFLDQLDRIREWGLHQMVESIKSTLERFGVKFDRWFSERSLHEWGKVKEAVEKLRQLGYIYEGEGAVWFRSANLGTSGDRVLIRSDGSPTYLAADIAYLVNKSERGFDKLIYVWSSDHHGQVDDLLAAAKALGAQDKVDVLLYQMVNLYRSGQPVRMSTRAGEMVTLDELIDEVGVDGARFTFLLRSFNSVIDFDLDLVKAESQENPVYYVQYAYARICSILRYGEEHQVTLWPIEEVRLTELIHESEHELIRKLAEYPETIMVAANLRAPYRLTAYAQNVAALFHAFYRDCRVITHDMPLTQARLWLAEATRQVLANTLGVLGVNALERM
jgi:arginyl-tRNA synthetase